MGGKTEIQHDLGTEYFAWKKTFEREKRFFYIRKKFVPNLRAKCITGKFYARHDVLKWEDANQNFVEMIEKEYAKGPKESNKNPATENQCYGWYSETYLPLQKGDPRLHHNHQKSNMTRVAEQILLGTRDMPKAPPFMGIPFKI